MAYLRTLEAVGLLLLDPLVLQSRTPHILFHFIISNPCQHVILYTESKLSVVSDGQQWKQGFIAALATLCLRWHHSCNVTSFP